MTGDENLWTPRELSKFLGYSESTIYRMLHAALTPTHPLLRTDRESIAIRDRSLIQMTQRFRHFEWFLGEETGGENVWVLSEPLQNLGQPGHDVHCAGHQDEIWQIVDSLRCEGAMHCSKHFNGVSTKFTRIREQKALFKFPNRRRRLSYNRLSRRNKALLPLAFLGCRLSTRELSGHEDSCKYAECLNPRGQTFMDVQNIDDLRAVLNEACDGQSSHDNEKTAPPIASQKSGSRTVKLSNPSHLETLT